MSLRSELKDLKEAAIHMPPPDAASKVLKVISRGSPYDNLFFSELKDAAWLKLLQQSGFFSFEREPEVSRPHLPLFGLAKLAEHSPTSVSDVLVGLPLPSSPTINEQVLRCIAGISDRKCVTQLRPIVSKLAEGSTRASWIWIEEILKKWVRLESFGDALAVVQPALLAAADATRDDQYRIDVWEISEIDREVLEVLTPKYPMEVANAAIEGLSRWAAHRLRGVQLSQLDADIESQDLGLYSYWIEDFKNRPEDHSNLETILALRIFTAAENLYRQGNLARARELDLRLRSKRWNVFRRIRWQLYAEFPDVTCVEARHDVLARIPNMKRSDYVHDYELAQVLHAHSKVHGAEFLSEEEVRRMADVILSGPVTDEGKAIEDEYQKRFHIKQLHPIVSLLKGTQLAIYEELVKSEAQPIDLERYKPVRSFQTEEARFIQSVAPPESQNLGLMPSNELWQFLNSWQPNKTGHRQEWWVDESASALAVKFTDFLASHPERFDPSAEWWRNLTRPIMLEQPLDRAAKRLESQSKGTEEAIASPSEWEWSNWFGISKWITLQRPIAGSRREVEEVSEHPDWTWSRILVAKFLQNAVRTKVAIPPRYHAEIRELLMELITGEDPRLQDTGNELEDWLTKAINSVRGDAIDALLELALSQKKAKDSVDDWIFELIRTRLELPQESPAVFALLGSRLRLLLYLFSDALQKNPHLLFPSDRLLHRNAAIVSHFCYDRPMTTIIRAFPNLVELGLATGLQILVGSDRKKTGRDFLSQLGIHIAFYYWNAAFVSTAEGEHALDRFFEIAPSETRARVISEIASIFEKVDANEQQQEFVGRTMRIWERRFAQIRTHLAGRSPSADAYQAELSEFTDWLGCECFPFKWRFEYSLQSIERLTKAPRSYQLLATLSKLSNTPDRLPAVLQLLSAILSKPSDELRWSIRAKDLAPLLSEALANDNASVRIQAEQIIETLLKLGFFEFLELEARQPSTL